MACSDDDDEFEAYDFSEFTAQEIAEIDAELARKSSPFANFRASKKKKFSVSDLVCPAWCEVQFEYSLYGHRNKPVHQRPSSFKSRSGKQINVHQHVAHTNDRRLERGKSVHKALHVQLCPEKLVVRTVSEEDRFGLCLIQLLDGFGQLVTDGITRELPVFTITHSQVVYGVIDEILYLPVARPDQPPPPTSRSPPPKKPRLQPSAVPHELHIRDYKTRRSSTIPLDQDSLSPRLQLMLYHRMLSALLEPEAFDFNLLWNRLNLNPTQHFSPQFAKDVAWHQRQGDPNLNSLLSQWFAIVQQHRPQIIRVSRQLQLIYRQSPTHQPLKGKDRPLEPPDIEDPLDALVLQERLDLARAIELSLADMGHPQPGQLAHDLAQNDSLVGPSSIAQTSASRNDLVTISDPVQSDPSLARAIHDALLTCAPVSEKDFRSQDNPPSDGARLATNNDITPIIGTKQFNMDDDALDEHLADVLQWWFGARPARGVDIAQTNRCFTCEYQDSCEWREKKAKEALALASERRIQQNKTSTSVWSIVE